MTCNHCGIEMAPSLTVKGLYEHPGGPCPQQTFLIGGEAFTLAEVEALKRVARAQLEIEARRGRNG